MIFGDVGKISRLMRLNVHASVLARQVSPIFGYPHFFQTEKMSQIILNSKKSGAIYRNFNNREIVSIRSNQKFSSLLSHWESGLSWTESGIFEIVEARRMTLETGRLYKDFRDTRDILDYYKEMDRIFESVIERGLEVPPSAFKSNHKFTLDGITFEIGCNGEIYFAGRGSHRLAMSIAARQTYTPGYIVGICGRALINRCWQENLMRTSFISDKT